eukprot:5831282-Pyramimonas_sp.AAC.1
MLGLSIAVHAASETDAGACRVVRHAWPDVMELGDAQLLVEKDVRIIRDRADMRAGSSAARGPPAQTWLASAWTGAGCK